MLTLDMDPGCNPSILWDMETLPLPFDDAAFCEIHLYDSLEHWGRQGDWRGFFAEFAEYHRLLSARGFLCIIVPVGEDRFADPGHCRFFTLNHFLMLSQDWYAQQIALGERVTDYRWYWKLDFRVQFSRQDDNHLYVVLERA